MVSNVAGAHQVVSGFGFRFDLHTLHTGIRIKVRIKARMKVQTRGAEA